MKKILTILTAALLLSSTIQAQHNLASHSIDPDADADAIARMRHKMDSIRKYRPTVALVLAGGGAKGAAHIGALEYIEELGIPIDMVLGTSMGGLVGGLVSMGYNAKTIDSILTNTNWGVMLSDQVPVDKMAYMRRKYNDTYFIRTPFRYESDEWERRAREEYHTRKVNEEQNRLSTSEVTQQFTSNIIANLPDGYIYGYNVNKIINSLTVGYQDSIDFSTLPIPYCCVATDLVSMKAKYWTSGYLPDAMRSTMSIPFFFTPLRRDGHIFIDGGTRNNFPTDMARAMGSDYIIGVNLSQPRTYSEINGMSELLLQCISLMGKDALDVTVPLADVYIKPDMSGMNMMSFDSLSIAECLHRGYIAAQSQGEKLKAIKEKVGSQHTTHLSNVPAINVNDHKVVIGHVEYDGIDERLASYFRKKSIIADSGLYSSSEIEEEMAVMYGSGLFDQVSYSLYGDKEPFTLTFHCKRGPIHQFGFGLHFDSRTMLSAAINVGFNRRKLSGFKADFTLFVGNNPSATIDMKYAFLNGPSIGIRLHTRYQNLISQSAQQAITSIINSEDQNKSVWYNHAEIYAITHSWRDGFAKLGFEYHSTPYEQTVYYYRDSDNPFANPYYKERIWVGNRITRSRNWNVFTFGPSLELVYDNTDDSYFPTKGIDMGIKYSFYIYQSYKLKFDLDDTDSLFIEKQHLESSPDSPKQVTDETIDYYIAHDLSHNLNLHIKKVFALHPRIALIPSLWGNLNFDNKNMENSGNYSDWLTCYIGGTTAGRFYPNQLPYIGYNLPHYILYSPICVVGNVDLRFRVGSKLFLTLTAAGYSTIMTKKMTEYRMNTITDYALALQVGYQSMIGPISFNVHWSRYNEPTKWGCYLSMGLDL